MGSSRQGQENRSHIKYIIMIYVFVPVWIIIRNKKWTLDSVLPTLSPLAETYMMSGHDKARDPRTPSPTPSTFITAWRGLFNSLSWGNLPLVLIFSEILTPVSFQLRVLKRLLAGAPRETTWNCSRMVQGDNVPEALEDLLLEHLYPLLAGGSHTKEDVPVCYQTMLLTLLRWLFSGHI